MDIPEYRRNPAAFAQDLLGIKCSDTQRRWMELVMRGNLKITLPPRRIDYIDPAAIVAMMEENRWGINQVITEALRSGRSISNLSSVAWININNSSTRCEKKDTSPMLMILDEMDDVPPGVWESLTQVKLPLEEGPSLQIRFTPQYLKENPLATALLTGSSANSSTRKSISKTRRSSTKRKRRA